MKKQILLVEDNPIEAREIEFCLREAGFHVEVSGDAERGFARLESEHFDLLLCDLLLPGENGFVLCQRVKQTEALQSTPVVLLTRDSDPLNYLRGLEAGADGFISKGQSARDICERLCRVLSRQETRAQNPQYETDRVVFLQNEFEITSQRSQLLEVLLAGFEDVVKLNSKYQQEAAARVEAQKAMRDAYAMYLSLVETLAVGVVRKDVDGKYAFANKMACEILGKRIEEVVGKTDFDLFPRELAEKRHASDCQVMKTGQMHEEYVEDDNTRFGKRCFHLRRSPVRNSEGDIVGTQITSSDITELKHTEAELILAKEIAEKASLTKSRFLSSMSHELRTPLNGVIGMTELLAGTVLSVKQQRYVDACRNSGESLLQLINNTLDISKIEAGMLELDLHKFDLEEVVANTVDTLAWRAVDKALEMPCFIDRAAQTILMGDSHRLRQILVNLLGNAIKFTEAGEVVVRTITTGQQDDRITIRFSVSDTGIGIPSDKFNRLFQSFSQVDACTTRNYGGTGLGLAISQSLVELMGGTIGVDSESGKGSTFWFELPFVRVSDSSKSASDQSQLAGLRALIVDDNETHRTILAEYASDWEIASTTASSVDEALAAFDHAKATGSPFHVVLTDYNMPERSGLELSRALKQHSQLAVLLLASTDVCLNPDRLRELGIDAVVRKPLRRHELYNVLCDTLGCSNVVTKLAAVKPHSTSDTRQPSGHILLAEDNSINTMYFVELLSHLGYTCDVAANGREATMAVRRRNYGLVLMDCHMPEMDGFQATQRIRKWETDGILNGHLPIIALTANAASGDRERCLAAGMDEYLSKPVQQSEIMSLLEQFLGQAAEQATT